MKIDLKILLSVFVFSILNHTLQAQKELRGIISGYDSGPSQIISFDRFSGSNQTWAEINPEGEFSIGLEDNFLQKVRKLAEEAEKNAPSGFTISFRTVSETFSCTYEEVKTEGGDVVVSGIPELNISDEMGNPSNGILYATSSKEIAEWLYSYGDGEISLGYYLEFYFLEAPAKAIGDCLLEVFTGSDEESYEESTSIELDLQAGWNIIRYGIEEVFTSSTGKIFPSKLTVSRLENLPEDLKWYAIRD